MHYLKLRNKNDNFIWPSFVDALASLLIVIIFILMIFVISQYYISQKLSGKDKVLTKLEAKILEITNQLSIEKEMTKRLSANIFNIQSELDNKDLELLCGLMIEAAYTDGQIDKNELNKIKLSLVNTFEEDPKDIDRYLEEALKNKNN